MATVRQSLDFLLDLDFNTLPAGPASAVRLLDGAILDGNNFFERDLDVGNFVENIEFVAQMFDQWTYTNEDVERLSNALATLDPTAAAEFEQATADLQTRFNEIVSEAEGELSSRFFDANLATFWETISGITTTMYNAAVQFAGGLKGAYANAFASADDYDAAIDLFGIFPPTTAVSAASLFEIGQFMTKLAGYVMGLPEMASKILAAEDGVARHEALVDLSQKLGAIIADYEDVRVVLGAAADKFDKADLLIKAMTIVIASLETLDERIAISEAAAADGLSGLSTNFLDVASAINFWEFGDRLISTINFFADAAGTFGPAQALSYLADSASILVDMRSIQLGEGWRNKDDQFEALREIKDVMDDYQGVLGTALAAADAALVEQFGADTGQWGLDIDTNNPSIDKTILGSNANDMLMGGQGDDTLRGGLGNDTMEGAEGADHHVGSFGGDTVQYTKSSHGVFVSLEAGIALFGDAQGDTFEEIEHLTGSDHNDQLLGDAFDNTLKGGRGNDVLYGAGGRDILTGGSGEDRFVLSGDGLDVITDYDSFGINYHDIVDVAEFVGNAFAAGTEIDDLVRVIRVSSDEGDKMLLQVNRDGTAATYGWETLAQMGGVAVRDRVYLALDETSQEATTSVVAGFEPPNWSFEVASDTVAEDSGAVTLTLRRNDSTAAEKAYVTTKDYFAHYGEVNTGDYTPLTNHEVAFAAGQEVATFTVNILDDSEYEGSQRFGLELQPEVVASGDRAPYPLAQIVLEIADDEVAPVTTYLDLPSSWPHAEVVTLVDNLGTINAVNYEDDKTLFVDATALGSDIRWTSLGRSVYGDDAEATISTELSTPYAQTVILGTDFDDYLVQYNETPDVWYGRGGNDKLESTGADTLFGGLGNDNLTGTTGAMIYGGEGDDGLSTETGGVLLDGGAGQDSAYLNLSDIDADNSYDIVIDENTLTMRGANPEMSGIDLDIVDVESYRLYFGSGDETLNTVIASSKTTTFSGGSGNDTVLIDMSQIESAVRAQGDSVRNLYTPSEYNGLDTDFFVKAYFYNFEQKNFIGTAHGDQFSQHSWTTIHAGNGDDQILDNTQVVSDDVFYGEDGNDLITHASGADYADGGEGYDQFNTRPTTERVVFDIDARGNLVTSTGTIAVNFERIGLNGSEEGSHLNLTIDGQSDIYLSFIGFGSDTATVFFSADNHDDTSDSSFADLRGVSVSALTAYGSTADDRLSATSNGDITAWLGDGDDHLLLGYSSFADKTYEVYGGNGDDVLFGGAGLNQLYGDDGNDALTGGDGINMLYGGAGNDTMIGQGADDHLYGGTGANTLQGREGFDTAYFDFSTDDILLTNFTEADAPRFLTADSSANMMEIEQLVFTNGTFSTEEFVALEFEHRYDFGRFEIAGDPLEGSVVSIDGTGLVDTVESVTVSQWFRDGAPITGAIYDEYRLTQDDVGAVITAQVEAYGPLGEYYDISGGATSPISNLNQSPSGQVFFTQQPVEGNAIEIDTRWFSDQDGIGALEYAWFRDGTVIPQVDNASYIPGELDIGFALTATVSYLDDYGTRESLTATSPQLVEAGIFFPNTSSDGDDYFKGADEGDSFAGGLGNDQVFAGGGDDTVSAGSGNDLVYGGAGRDLLRGGRGEDLIDGGEDNDQLRGQRNADTLYGGGGEDNIKGGGGNDLLYGGDGNDFIKGGTRADEMYGDAGNDRIAGNGFDDILDGGAGNDSLNAGGDDDRLTGGTGNDWLKGGAGSDVFVFDTGHGIDFVQDFNLSQDMIEISAALANGRTALEIAQDHYFNSDNTLVLVSQTGDEIILNGLVTSGGLDAAITIVQDLALDI